MNIPILCFVGRSNSGKTTLIERLIPELVQAGYRVATIKHAGHGFNLDTEGKDSWRHKQAGASTVIVLSKGSLAMFSDVSDQIKVEELRDRFLDKHIDLIIAEGEPEGESLPADANEPSLDQILARATHAERLATAGEALDAADPDDIASLTALIIRHFPKRPKHDR